MNFAPEQPNAESPVRKDWQTADDRPSSENAAAPEHAADGGGRPATVVVRGEVVPDQDSNPRPGSLSAQEPTKSHGAAVSDVKVKLQHRLPALEDEADIGAEKEQRVIRDGKADLAFTGTLLASAAPSCATDGHWQEYRVYKTNGGKHVFSRAIRSVSAIEPDRHEAEVFDPTPSSVPSQLARTARELTRSRPLMWTDAAVSFFGYDPLAKVLYRKLGSQFDEHIS
jgi:hypothetical protein